MGVCWTSIDSVFPICHSVQGNVGTAAYLNVFGSIHRVLKELQNKVSGAAVQQFSFLPVSSLHVSYSTPANATVNAILNIK